MNPAIVVVTYNRPDSLRRLLNSISKAKYDKSDIPLIISIDKANNEKEVVKIAEEFEWEYGNKIIRTFPERQGLRKHVLQCGDLSFDYDATIILEDDLIVSPGFYSYVCKALSYYKDEECITGIALYSHEWNGYAYKFFSPTIDKYDTYLGQFSITWGQCWTKKWWQKFRSWYQTKEDRLEYNDKLPDNINKWSKQSWGKYFANYIVENDKYYVIPRVSLSTNCSEIGQHAKVHDSDHQVIVLSDNKTEYQFAPIDEALKYDIYFESMNILTCFEPEITKDGVVIDIAGYDRKVLDSRYILSSLFLDYKVIKSYGLEFRPPEMNVVMDVPGCDLFLYDTYEKSRKPKKNYNYMRYEIRGTMSRKILQYSLFILQKKLRSFFRKLKQENGG